MPTTFRSMSKAPLEARMYNLDQYCPLCYEKTGEMRNVFKESTATEQIKPLYCDKHGLVLYEDFGKLRYSDPQESPGMTGMAKVGFTTIGSKDQLS